MKCLSFKKLTKKCKELLISTIYFNGISIWCKRIIAVLPWNTPRELVLWTLSIIMWIIACCEWFNLNKNFLVRIKLKLHLYLPYLTSTLLLKFSFHTQSQQNMSFRALVPRNTYQKTEKSKPTPPSPSPKKRHSTLLEQVFIHRENFKK